MPYSPYYAAIHDRPALDTPATAAFFTHMETGIATAQTTAENAGGGGGPGAPGTLLVASTDAPTRVKNVADYVCDGTADEVQINAALDLAAGLNSRTAAMPAGAEQLGRVCLTGGRFNLAASVQCHTGTWLSGAGYLTELRAVSMGSAHMVTLSAVNAHLVRASDMWINGNSSSGGTGNGIDFDMTSSGVTSAYPDTNPDSYHLIHDLFISNMANGTAARTAIHLWAASTANNRGNIIDRIQIRNVSNYGIHLEASSDSFVSNVHMGTVQVDGFRIQTGNTKMANCKSFYCDGYGFNFTSGRHSLVGLESQDNASGFIFDGSDICASGLVCDTSSTNGIVISNSGLILDGFNIFVRGGGRYATQTTGLYFDGTYSDLVVIGRVNPSNITTKISGAAGSRSFMRVSDGSSLVSVG